jgi:membrane protease YdiL (CAAX protease family)
MFEILSPLIRLSLLAQATPEGVEVPVPVPVPITGGQALAGLTGLTVILASAFMGASWVRRLVKSGEIFPMARRGYWRVPQVLTIVVAGFSMFLVCMVLAHSLFPEKDKEPGVPELSDISPEMQLRSLLSIVEYDVIVLAVLATSVLLASRHGRTDMHPPLLEHSGGADPPEFVEVADSRLPRDRIPSDQIVDESGNRLPDSEAGGEPDSFSIGNSAEAEEEFSLATELRYAVEVFLAIYLPTLLLRLTVVNVAEMITGDNPGQHPLLEVLKAGVDVRVMLMIVITAVALAPLVEELQYRVVLLGGFAQKGRPVLAMILSSILFGLAHGPIDGVALLPLAFVLGYAYRQRRSYFLVVMVHFLFNAFNMLLMMMTLYVP